MTLTEKIHNFLLELYTLSEPQGQVSLTNLVIKHKVSTALPVILKKNNVIKQKNGITYWIYDGKITESFALLVQSWLNEYYRETANNQRRGYRDMKLEKLQGIESKLDLILNHLNINQ